MENKRTPRVTILVGLPCSGKSTWVNENKKEGDIVLSTDSYILDYAREMKSTYNKVFPLCIKQADQNLKNELKFAIANNFDIIWDQTNLSPKTRKKKLAKIPSNYQRKVVIFIADNKTINERNELRKSEDRNIGFNKLNEMIKIYDTSNIDSEDFYLIEYIREENSNNE